MELANFDVQWSTVLSNVNELTNSKNTEFYRLYITYYNLNVLFSYSISTTSHASASVVKHGATFFTCSQKITTIAKQPNYFDMRGLIYILEVPLSCNMQILVKLMEWGLTKCCKQCFEKHFSLPFFPVRDTRGYQKLVNMSLKKDSRRITASVLCMPLDWNSYLLGSSVSATYIR